MIYTPADENPHQGYHSMLLNACEEYRAKVDKLEAENLAMRNEIAWLNSQTMWICACGGTDCAGQKENAALRKALVDADELERYIGSNGERQWGRCSAWLHPDDAVIIISAKALDAARKDARPICADHSGDINEMIQKAKEAQR